MIHNATLYTFRRCPYAMRARMAMLISEFEHTEIEVDLKNKPAEMLKISPKGTVPVLNIGNEQVIDESLDIIRYALALNDEHDVLGNTPDDAWDLIAENDTLFKKALDRYKYPNRYEEDKTQDWQALGEAFLLKLNNMLSASPFLYGDDMCVADIAIFPFVRQYRAVNKEVFDNNPDWPELKNWLESFINSEAFAEIMKK